MAMTIKDLAKELNCSYEAVRKQVKRYGNKDLKDHIFTQHKTQYLDDFACDFIRSRRMDSPVVVSRIEHDEAVEILKQKYMDLLERHDKLKDEHQLLIEQKNDQIALLEADNEEAKGKIAQAEKTAQEAQEGLVQAQEAYEKDLRQKNERIDELEKYAAACKARDEFFAVPWFKRIGKKAPTVPELKEG